MSKMSRLWHQKVQEAIAISRTNKKPTFSCVYVTVMLLILCLCYNVYQLYIEYRRVVALLSKI